MNTKYFATASGLTAVFLYIGCWILMGLLGQDLSVKFFNSLLHGLDVSSVFRMDVPIAESCAGLISTFIIAWLMGFSIASLYNLQSKKSSRS